MNSASAVGSTTGSLANDVSRFSRLFSDQVCADPDAVTMVPKWALAMTFDPGQRRFLVAFEDDRVGAALVGEAAEAVGQASSTAARSADRRTATRVAVDGRRRANAGRRCALDRMRLVEVRAQIAAVAAERPPARPPRAACAPPCRSDRRAAGRRRRIDASTSATARCRAAPSAARASRPGSSTDPRSG